MPKYTIELNGRDKDHPRSTCVVRDESGVVLGECEAVLTEVALIGALRLARGGSDQVLWETCIRLEKGFVEYLEDE